MPIEEKRPSTTYLLVGFILLVLLVFATRSAVSTLVWSDDFNDGNYDGWTVTFGSFTTADNYLQAMGASSSCIHHPSTVNVGTWSCDVYISGGGSSGAHICFSCEDMVMYPETGYDLKIGPNAFELMVWVSYYDWPIGSYYPPTGVLGWQHIDVTRDATGLIRVFVNGTMQIEVEDTSISTSNYFHLFCGPHEALDNVVVSDSIDITPAIDTTPDTPTIPPIPGVLLATIALGLAIAVGLVLIIRRHR